MIMPNVVFLNVHSLFCLYRLDMATNTTESTMSSNADNEHASRIHNAEKHLVIWIIGPIILFGVTGNILSIITLRTRSFRMFQSTFLLIALACCDTGVLLIDAMYDWIDKVTGDDFDLALVNRGFCKLPLFVGYLMVVLSAWTLVLITLERLISVSRPDLVHLFSTNRIRVGWALMLGILVSLTLYEPILVDIFKTSHFDPETNTTTFEKDCDFRPKDREMLSDFSFWWDLFLGSVMPGLLIFIFNAIIIRKFAGPYRHFGDRSMIPQPTRKPSSITVMLVVVSIVFLITTFPVRLYQVGYRSWWKDLAKSPIQSEKESLTYTCLAILYYINNAINFILYMAVNPLFRRAFLGVFCCKKAEEPAESDIGEPIANVHTLHPIAYGSQADQEGLVDMSE